MQITVLGVHRSGTSALTRLINLMGAYVGTEGSTASYSIENAKGYWERHDVMALNDELLQHYHCTWNDLLHWDTDHEPLPEALQDKIKHILFEMDHHRPWVMKDPRMCQTFPLWKAHMEAPLAVMVWRDPIEVAMSLHTRDIPLLHGLAIWEHCTRSSLMAIQDVPHIIINHADIINTPVETVKRVYDWLTEHKTQGIHLPSNEEITAFIDPSLHRAKAKKNDLTFPIPEAITQLLDSLRNNQKSIPPLSELSKQAFALYRQTNKEVEEKASLQDFSDQQAERIRELEAIATECELRTEIKQLFIKQEELKDEIERVKYSGILGRLQVLFKGMS